MNCLYCGGRADSVSERMLDDCRVTCIVCLKCRLMEMRRHVDEVVRDSETSAADGILALVSSRGSELAS